MPNLIQLVKDIYAAFSRGDIAVQHDLGPKAAVSRHFRERGVAGHPNLGGDFARTA